MIFVQVLPNLFLSIFSRMETSKIFTSYSYSFLAYNSNNININNSITSSTSTSGNSQSKAMIPKKTRRSKCLYPNTNIAASKEKPTQHLKDLPANKKIVKSILCNKEKSA